MHLSWPKVSIELMGRVRVTERHKQHRFTSIVRERCFRFFCCKRNREDWPMTSGWNISEPKSMFSFAKHRVSTVFLCEHDNHFALKFFKHPNKIRVSNAWDDAKLNFEHRHLKQSLRFALEYFVRRRRHAHQSLSLFLSFSQTAEYLTLWNN